MRREPYTTIGIKRVPCARCGEKSHAQWNICALGKSFHGLCSACDVDLNALVLDFIRHPKKDVLMKHYKEEVQQVLDALAPLSNAHFPDERICLTDNDVDAAGVAITLLQSKLAEKDAEPFGYWHQGPNEDESEFFLRPNGPGAVACDRCIPLFTHHAPKQVPMTDFDLRGRLAQLKCWHRLTGEEAKDLIEVVQRERLSEKVPMTDEQAAAIRTLTFLGHTYHGAEHWKPPLGTQLPIHEFGRAIEAVLTENQHTK